MPNRGLKMNGNIDLNAETELTFLDEKKYNHFESKTLLPGYDPDHLNKCWEKCDNNPNIKNMKEELLRKVNEYSRSLSHDEVSTNSQLYATNQ